MTFMIDFESRLEQIFNELLKADRGDDWQHALTTERGSFHVRAKSDSTLLTHYDYNVNMRLDEAIRMWRPEALCFQDHPIYESFMESCSIVKSFAPGDLVCSFQPKGRLAAILHLLSPVSFRSRDWAGGDQYLFRMVFRRDFPCVGNASLAVVDMGNGVTGDWGVMITGTEIDSISLCREVFDLPRMPNWLLQRLLRLEFNCFDYPSLLEAASVQTHQALENACGFMVVALKQCRRGLPLVPSVSKDATLVDDFCWVPQDDSEAFGFSHYLHRVLVMCGLDPRDISDQLDGRQVVSFQAVVKKDSWYRLWKSFAPLFKKQRAAYRRYYGGSGAPQVQVDVLPRFCTEQAYPRENMQCIASIDDDALPVKNTFIQFTTNEYQELLSGMIL